MADNRMTKEEFKDYIIRCLNLIYRGLKFEFTFVEDHRGFLPKTMLCVDGVVIVGNMTIDGIEDMKTVFGITPESTLRDLILDELELNREFQSEVRKRQRKRRKELLPKDKD